MTTGLWDSAKRQEILERMGRLTPQSERQWGSMQVTEMLAHQIDCLEVALGHKDANFPENASAYFLANPVGRWLVIDAPMPWPRGKIKGPRVFFTGESSGFDADVARIRELIEEFAGRDSRSDFGRSPLLGKLSGKNWAKLLYRHFDHHWCQFGV